MEKRELQHGLCVVRGTRKCHLIPIMQRGPFWYGSGYGRTIHYLSIYGFW